MKLSLLKDQIEYLRKPDDKYTVITMNQIRLVRDDNEWYLLLESDNMVGGEYPLAKISGAELEDALEYCYRNAIKIKVSNKRNYSI